MCCATGGGRRWRGAAAAIQTGAIGTNMWDTAGAARSQSKARAAPVTVGGGLTTRPAPDAGENGAALEPLQWRHRIEDIVEQSCRDQWAGIAAAWYY